MQLSLANGPVHSGGYVYETRVRHARGNPYHLVAWHEPRSETQSRPDCDDCI